VKPREDLTVANHGSIFLLTPTSKRGRAWVAENIPENAMTWGPSIAVEHRYIQAIVDGATADGLKVR
jgi:hypothetical protein